MKIRIAIIRKTIALLNIGTYIIQFVNEQILRYMQCVSQLLNQNYNLPKHERANEGQLGPKDPLNDRKQTNQANGGFSQHFYFMYSATDLCHDLPKLSGARGGQLTLKYSFKIKTNIKSQISFEKSSQSD